MGRIADDGNARIAAALRRCRRGAAAVEFALVLPLLATMLFGLIVYGQYFYLAHGLQQVANDAARATIAGLNARERSDLARAAARAHVGRSIDIDPARLDVRVSDAGDFTTVALRYDGSGAALFRVGLLPAPDPIIRRMAVVRMGGL